ALSAQRDQAHVELQTMTTERDREATASRQDEENLGRVTGEHDTALQAALTSRDADMIPNTTRLGAEALFYRISYYRV
ncbi:hypothetical protein KI387_037157, partial [Taxus chinensis]